MGMGYGADYADVICGKDVEKYVQKEFQHFMITLDKWGVGIEEFARNASVDEFEDYDHALVKAYKTLCNAFKKKTKLSLYLAYHDCESDGSRYDEIDGEFWAVVGMYQLSPAGKKMKKCVQRKHFVAFG